MDHSPLIVVFAQLQERDQDIEALSAALEKRKEADQAVVSVPPVDVEGPRRSQRLMTQADQSRLQAELDQCRAELSARTQGELRMKTLPWLCFDLSG